MDLTWRRCFVQSFIYDGFIIRPYLEIQTLLLDWWLNAIECDGVNYEIEQTITLREYIKRSPESLPKIKKMISEGKLIILGGGESIIDYNLSDGEAIIRNHLYSRRYLTNEFGYTPKFAACPDSFGLSAQLPQLFRMIGYPAISSFHRVFKNARPVWQGISGHLIAIETNNINDVEDNDFVKYLVCTNCEGEGCLVCDFTGIDIYYRHFSLHEKLESLHIRMSEISNKEGDIVFSIGSEEVLEPDHFHEFIDGIAKQYEYEAVFTNSEAVITERYSELINSVEKNTVKQDNIDDRREGNPVASGCYISRIKIKQENRKVEAALQAAERFATIATGYGFTYPQQALEELWRKLAIYQFHDALPASHSDAAYEELINMARDIKTSAMRITRRATELIAKNIPSGNGHAFAIFNPLSWDLKNKRLEAVLRLPKDSPCPAGKLLDADDNVIKFTSSKRIEGLSTDSWQIEFYGDIPALGYNTFRFIEEQNEDAASEIPLGEIIENEYYRITLNRRGIESIYDKKMGVEVANDGVCSPFLSDDMGSLWGAWSNRFYTERADKPFFVEIMTPFRGQEINVSSFRKGTVQKAVVEILYGRPEKGLEELHWKMTMSLQDSSNRIEFHIETNWNAKDLRISARFPLNFTTLEDRGVYEIPLGQLERPYTHVYDSVLANSDDHATLRYFCAYNPEQDYTVGLFNTGTPAHRFQDGVLYIGLMRSPTDMLCSYNIENAREKGNHEFTFGFTSWKGKVEAGRPAQIGWEYNACFPYQPLYSNAEILPGKSSLFPEIPNGIMLSGLKMAEEGSDIILHCYEPYGVSVNVECIPDSQECDLLTEQPIEGGSSEHYSPFEIKALRVGKKIG